MPTYTVKTIRIHKPFRIRIYIVIQLYVSTVSTYTVKTIRMHKPFLCSLSSIVQHQLWYLKCSTQIREKKFFFFAVFNSTTSILDEPCIDSVHIQKEKIFFFFVSTVSTYRKKNILFLCIDSIDIRNLSNLMYH